MITQNTEPVFKESFRILAYMLIFSIALFGISHLLIGQASAENATLEYHQEPLHNDPLELYVTQGDTLYLGKTYDLSGVTPITHLYAHWNNWKNENTDCFPSTVIDTWYIETLTDERAVWLGGSKGWAVGDWYYWDPVECSISHYDYSQQKVVVNDAPLPADNKLAFIIINARAFDYTLSPPALDAAIKPIDGYKSAFNQSL